LWIERSDFQDVAVPDESHRHIVIEVNRARRPRADLIRLSTGFREHQRLRIRIDIELLEDRRQIAQAVGNRLEFHLAALQALLQTRHGVISGPLAVLNRRVIQWNIKCVLQLLRGQPRNGSYRNHKCANRLTHTFNIPARKMETCLEVSSSHLIMKSVSLVATVVLSAVVLRAQGGFPPPQLHNSSVVGIASGQTAKLNVFYPSLPAPLLLQAMCAVTASIVDDQGGVLKTQDFQMIGGKTASLSLNADTDLPNGHTAQIHALTLTPAASPAGGYCQILPSLDIVDNATGKTILHLETTITYPLSVATPGIRPR
jgi:hypothetical protein